MQYRPELSAKDIKSLLMNGSALISDKDGKLYPISRQGAGRVRAYQSAISPFVVSHPAVSLGEVQADKKRKLRKSINVKNASEDRVRYRLSVKEGKNISVKLSRSSLSLGPGEEQKLDLDIQLDATEDASSELDAFLQLKEGQKVLANVPIMGVVNKMTKIQLENLAVHAVGAQGGNVDLTLRNRSRNAGEALVFNLLGKDARKTLKPGTFRSVSCDLESSGYRVVEKNGTKFLQFGVKIYNPVLSWRSCSVQVEIDTNGDKIADQEIFGGQVIFLPGLGAIGKMFGSVLFDSEKLREIKKQYELDLAKSPVDPPGVTYLPAVTAVGDLKQFDHSTIAYVETELDKVTKTANSEVSVRVTVTFNGGNAVEADDKLSNGSKEWRSISLDETLHGFHGMPEETNLDAGATQVVSMLRGAGLDDKLIAYFPRNRFILQLSGKDSQSKTARAERVNPHIRRR